MEKKNLIEYFLAAAEQDRAQVHFWHGSSRLERYSYRELAQGAFQVATFLRDQGIRRGDIVAIVLPTHPDFYRAFFGAMLAGAIPSALYPPVRLGKIEEWKTRSARMLQTLRCQTVLTHASLHSLLGYPLREARPSRGCFTMESILKGESGPRADLPVDPHPIAFVQFSSGTSGLPKPVCIGQDNVLHHAGFILDLVPGDAREQHCVSWLPVYHDMGLIGTLLSCMMFQANITLIPPELFLAQPKTWLEAITRMGGTISVAPNFAYGLCCKRISDEEMADLELSRWRTALCGAETIQAETLELFGRRFQAAGFDPRAFTPAYGLAEATLAVSVSAAGAGLLERRFDRRALEEEGSAELSEAGVRLVSVGRPIRGVQVEIRDELGTTLEAGKVGRLWVRGPNVMLGYLEDTGLTEQSLVQGWLDTGDRGFFFAGELYLCGRCKDVIIIRGKNRDPGPIEESLDRIPQLRTGCTVAFGELDLDSGTERLVILAECRDLDSLDSPEELESAIRKIVLRDHQLVVSEAVLLKAGTLPRTSSGKKQRQLAKQLWKQKNLLPPEERPGWIYLRERFKGYLQRRFS